MKAFQLSRYIKKWLPIIVVLCIGLTVAAGCFFSSSRTYVASAVIHYNDESAEEGLTPLGTELDVNEIKSSSVLSRVLYNLQLDETYSVDDLISRVKITEVVDEDEQARKEALLDEGEEYTYEPTTYIVSFEAKNQEGPDFARQVLDELLDQYFSDYSTKYINSATVNNDLSELYNGNYDYIEMAEIIDDSIDSAMETLNSRSGNTFRSTTTGLSFTDLANEFYLIQSVEVSALFSDILQNQVTKDKSLLVSDYSTRIQQNDIQNLGEDETIANVVQLIDTYVEKMRESDNTNITYEYILDEIYDKDLLDEEGNLVGSGDQTVTYDELIFSWREYSENEQYALIDSAYSQYIIDVFSGCTGGCGTTDGEAETAESTEDETEESTESTETEAEESTESTGTEAEESTESAQTTVCAQSTETCSALSDPEGYAEATERVSDRIETLVEELTALYEQVDETNDEYNEYSGAQSISMLSTASVSPSINVALYTAIAAVFLLIVCCGGAILVGRLQDIVDYLFYLDHMTGLNNRTAFDTYLKKYDRQILDDGVVCITLAITNQTEINRRCERSVGDELIRFFANTLKELFSRMNPYLVYNGSAQFIAIVEKTDYVTVEYIMYQFRQLLDRRDILPTEEIIYEIGIAETSRGKVHKMRGLLSKASGAQVKYVSGPVVSDAELSGQESDAVPVVEETPETEAEEAEPEIVEPEIVEPVSEEPVSEEPVSEEPVSEEPEAADNAGSASEEAAADEESAAADDAENEKVTKTEETAEALPETNEGGEAQECWKDKLKKKWRWFIS